jgi:hypothetical protein
MQHQIPERETKSDISRNTSSFYENVENHIMATTAKKRNNHISRALNKLFISAKLILSKNTPFLILFQQFPESRFPE